MDLSPYVPSSMNPPDMKERPIHRYDLYGVSVSHYCVKAYQEISDIAFIEESLWIFDWWSL